VRLFHIAACADWDAALETGEYRPPALVSDGYIHLSTDAQWEATARRFYRGRTDLVLLAIRGYRHDVRYESVDGERFPHLYGPLQVRDVLVALPLAASLEVPAEIAAWRTVYYGPPRIIALPADYVAAVRALDDGVQDVSLAAVRERELPTFYVCLGAKPGREGTLDMRTLKRVPVPNVDGTGLLQLPAFARTASGQFDEPALLAIVQALVATD
jgi:uncharacterized protein (DUF952 family)